MFGFGPETPLGAQNGLQFSNLFVSMQFDSASATPVKDFAFEAGQTVFDLSMSVSRTGSLYSRFPLRVTAMVQGSGKAMPASMGFIPLVSPLTSGALGNPWFGLEMSMSLGSQGGLAAKAGFYATFLAAWAPSIAAYNVAIGLRLPGAEGGSKSLTIQGPLKLDIGGITMLYNKDEKSYLMRFNDIALGFLGLKFPPNGRTNVLLFGDPNPDGPKTTLGWYAAYLKNKKPVPPTPPPPVVPPILPPKDVM